MKWFVFFVLLLVPINAFSVEQVIDTLGNADLISKDKIDSQGEKYGVDYYVLNRNSYPVYALLKATNQLNVYVNFPKSQFIIDEGEKVYIGWVVQIKQVRDSSWEVDWNVEH